MNKERGSITVTVECCRDCRQHQWNTRHDEQRYLHFFNEFQREASVKLGDAVFLRNFVPTKFLFAEVFKQVHKEDQLPQDGYQAIRPRVGAFEIYFETYCIYSKLTNGLWPHIPTVVKKLNKIIEAHQEGKDISPYTVELKTTQSECKERSKRSSSRFSSISPPPQRIQRNSSKHRNFSPLRTSHRSPYKPATSSLQKFSRFPGSSSTKIISKTTTPSLMQSKGYPAPTRYQNKLASGDEEEPSKPMFIAQSVQNQPLARAISQTQVQGSQEDITKTQDSVAQLPPLSSEPVRTVSSAHKQSGLKSQSPAPVEAPSPPSEEQSYKEEFENEQAVSKKESKILPQLLDDNASDLAPFQEKLPLSQKEYSVTSEHSPKKGEVIQEIEPMIVFKGDLNEEPSLISYAAQQSSIHSHQIQNASFQATLPNQEEFQQGFVDEPPSRIQTEDHSEVKEKEIVDALENKEEEQKDLPKQEYQQDFLQEITPPVARQPPEEEQEKVRYKAIQESTKTLEKDVFDYQEPRDIENKKENEEKSDVSDKKVNETKEEEDKKQNDSKSEQKSEVEKDIVKNEQKASSEEAVAKNDQLSEKKQEGEQEKEIEKRVKSEKEKKEKSEVLQKIESQKQQNSFKNQQKEESEAKIESEKNFQTEPDSVNSSMVAQKLIDATLDRAKESLKNQVQIQSQYTTFGKEKTSIVTVSQSSRQNVNQPIEEETEKKEEEVKEENEAKEAQQASPELHQSQIENDSKPEVELSLGTDMRQQKRNDEVGSDEGKEADMEKSKQVEGVKEGSRLEESKEDGKHDVSKAESFHKSRLEAQLKEKGDQGEPIIEIQESERQELFIFEGSVTVRERQKTEISEGSEVAKSEQ